MERYCVHIVVGWNFDGNGETSFHFEPHFFNTREVAEAFRADMAEQGIRTSEVMDLDEVDFD